VVIDNLTSSIHDCNRIIEYIQKNSKKTKFIILRHYYSNIKLPEYINSGFIADKIETVEQAKRINATYLRVQKLKQLKEKINAKK
jgi:MinD superfamily P-loop ATPase